MSRAIIVVPCYNEAMRLDLLALREFAREHPGPRFLFVNDGSTDGTRKILDELHCEARERFLVCHLRQNVGKAEAVRQGLLRAFEERPDYVGYWDADLATPLAAILTFCSILDFRLDIDMVFGARVCLLGREVRANPFVTTSGGSSQPRPPSRWGCTSTIRNVGQNSFAQRPRSRRYSRRPSAPGGSSMSRSSHGRSPPAEGRVDPRSSRRSTSFPSMSGTTSPAPSSSRPIG